MDEKAVSESCLRPVEVKGDSVYPIYFGLACALFAMKVEREIQELKKRRKEDGRANEKVVSIFAAQEQRWFRERKGLRQHIGSLINDLRILGRRKHDGIWELNKRLEEEGKKKKDLEKVVEELRDASKKEAEAHATELWKHKSAFIELVSNQRQLEAELGRAHRRAEESLCMLQKLSMELDKVRRDSEHKDKILSAMLRKSKLDTQEKQTLLKEMWVSKAKAKRERHGFKSMLRKQVGSRLAARSTNNNPIDLEAESVADSPHPDEQLEASSADVKQLVQAGKYRTAIEQRHQLELEAFSEQFRLKDEKLEAYHWRLMSMEAESKGLSSQIQGLSQSISHLRHNKLKLEASLVERETELKSLKDQITTHLNKQRSLDVVHQIETAKEITQKEVITNELLVKERLVWKMDVHALGVSYKIKRLKQQLVMLERVAGKQGDGEDEEHIGLVKGFLHLLSLLNKQVTRYHSLQDRADDLSKRMREKDLNVNQGESMRRKEDSRALEQFLEETFQLQRFIVATGQKSMELQSKIELGFSSMAGKLDGPTSFDVGQFSDSIQGLFREVQRGLEVRIARIIGDLEGTLASDGILFSQR